jgi:hypothetical protein
MPALSISWCLATALFGGIVGICELIGRYRDDPFAAIRCPYAIAYLMVNAAAAAAAYAIIVTMDWGFNAAPEAKPLVQAAVASFGAMAFFRSSLFNVKVGETEVAVGPAILFQVLMFATDRGVDRSRGETRSTLVAKIMKGVSFQLAKEALPNYCFELMQNVPLGEQQNFRQVVDALASKPPSAMRDSVKALNLGLMLMNVVGRQVLSTAVSALGERIQGPSSLEPPVIGLLRGVKFKDAYPALANLCFAMSNYGSDADQKVRQESVWGRGGWLNSPATELDDATKVTMLALALQQAVGDSVLVAALVQLSPSPADESARPQQPPVSAGAADDSNVVVMPQAAEPRGELGQS